MRKARRERWPPLPTTGLRPVVGRGMGRTDKGKKRIVEQCNKRKQVEKVEGNAASCVSTGTSYASEHKKNRQIWNVEAVWCESRYYLVGECPYGRPAGAVFEPY